MHNCKCLSALKGSSALLYSLGGDGSILIIKCEVVLKEVRRVILSKLTKRESFGEKQVYMTS